MSLNNWLGFQPITFASGAGITFADREVEARGIHECPSARKRSYLFWIQGGNVTLEGTYTLQFKRLRRRTSLGILPVRISLKYSGWKPKLPLLLDDLRNKAWAPKSSVSASNGCYRRYSYFPPLALIYRRHLLFFSFTFRFSAAKARSSSAGRAFEN